MQLNDAVRKLLYTERAEPDRLMPRCTQWNTFPDEGWHDGDDELVDGVFVRKDAMISPPPIIHTFLPACVRMRWAKAPIDSVTKWTPAGTEARDGRLEKT